MKMSSWSISISLIAFCLGSLVVNSFCELVIIHQKPQQKDDFYTFTCVSDDYHAALVWNDDIRSRLPFQNREKDLPQVFPGCAILGPDNCITYWQDLSDWKAVESAEYPTGPVFDPRWEDFSEFILSKNNNPNYEYVRNVPQSGTVVFSARELEAIHVILCETNIPSDNSCIRITIPTWPNEASVTRLCSHEETADGLSQSNVYCKEESYFKNEELTINGSEWRTFILTWDKDNRVVEISREFRIPGIKQFKVWTNINHLFIQSSDAGLIRFHFYKYLLTRKDNHTLSSTQFAHKRSHFCVKLWVSLCVECELVVSIVDSNSSRKKIGSISGSWKFVNGKLPIWQVVTFSTIVPNSYRYYTLEIYTMINQSGTQGWWAIDSFKKCEHIETVKSTKIDLPELRNSISHSVPIVGCQKLSYSPSAVVKSDGPITHKTPNSLRKCKPGFVGPYCVFKCTNSCIGTSICDKSGCICAPGFKGSDCDKDCPVGYSGYNCQTPCGFCKSGTCDKITGSCNSITSLTRRCLLPITPWNLAVKRRENNVITLSWDHLWGPSELWSWNQPWASIQKEELQKLKYSRQVYLSSSSTYRLHIQAINSCGGSSWAYVDYRVPASPRFASEEKLKVTRKASFLTLTLPSIMNDTPYTTVTVVVKGSSTCASSSIPDDIRKLLNMTASDEGWVAEIFNNPGSRIAQLTIGKNPNDDNSENCHIIDPHETYVIIVVVHDRFNGSPAVIASSLMYPIAEESGNRNLIWLVFPLILLICLLVFSIWRRKFLISVRRVRLQNIISYLQAFMNFVKSATTCTSQQPQPVPVPAIKMSRIVGTSQTVVWNSYSHSRSVNIEDLEDYVKESIASGLLRSQFTMLRKGMNRPCKYGSLPENQSKNRYINILPYDNSRVILKKMPDDPYSDYINANYVQGFRKKRAYIAAQGPKPQTVVDFWRMIWQEEALIICMLANVLEDQKVKCEQYWPEIGASKTYGDIVVTIEKHHVFADYTFRTFRVSCNEESRKIEHLHYTGWPDHSVPIYANSVIAYLRKLQSISITTGPIVVHCSAGVGRTGTIILCDICLRRANAKRMVDVLAAFKKLRDCRLNMVDNELQYLFAHLVIAEYLMSPSTELPYNNDLPQAIKEMKKKLPQHMERLRDAAWQNQALNSQIPSQPPLPEQLAKNRFPELAPGRSGLVYLERYPTHDSNSDYISTVIVDGLRAKKQYVASQLPLPTTRSDFWRLIAEQRIELVIVLQQPDPDDPTCCDIIPDGESFDPVPFITVGSKTSTDPGISTKIEELLLTEMFGVKERTQKVTVLTCQDWGLGKNGIPPQPKNLVELWRSSESIHRGKGPTLVLCHDGITGCGLYLALSFLLDRMAVEQECDVIFAVRAIRRFRPDFVQSQKQFEYLYDAAVEYAAFIETDSNFT